MAIQEVRYKCEVITPMFLMGGDGQTPEIRPPSIKGMMRFWWRALHPEFNNNEELLEKESKIFGSSEVGKSKLMMRIENVKINRLYCKSLPHKDERGNSFCDIKDNINGRGEFQKNGGMKLSIAPHNSTFDIVIYTTSEEDLENYSNIFEISVLLGGIGQRSRRGFGVINILEKYIDNKKVNFNNNIQESIKNILENIKGKDNIRKEEDTIIINYNNSGAEYPYLREVRIGTYQDTWEEVLLHIGKKTHKYGDEYCLGTTAVEIFDEERNRNRKKSVRFASPVYVSVCKIGENDGNNIVVPIISLLNVSLPNLIKEAREQQGKTGDCYESRKVNGFINEILKGGDNGRK